jgi:hypothetical protein
MLILIPNRRLRQSLEHAHNWASAGFCAAPCSRIADLVVHLCARPSCSINYPCVLQAPLLQQALADGQKTSHFPERAETMWHNHVIPHPQAPLLQQLAFQELAAVAQPPFAARRAGLWADDSGGTWRCAILPCLQQVLHSMCHS